VDGKEKNALPAKKMALDGAREDSSLKIKRSYRSGGKKKRALIGNRQKNITGKRERRTVAPLWENPVFARGAGFQIITI